MRTSCTHGANDWNIWCGVSCHGCGLSVHFPMFGLLERFLLIVLFPYLFIYTRFLIYVNLHTPISDYLCTWVSDYTQIRIPTYLKTCVSLYPRVCIHGYLSTQVCACLCFWILQCLCICMSRYLYMYFYVYIYIFTNMWLSVRLFLIIKR